ncbi:glycosyltransferase family 9 protein [Pyruvatibacter sp.]|uniref:glycosyltransferase family 9 protein n=1 Tax=Pyruvatibacter sp. TaxID=1981328 RepID=UPI0032EAA5D5
MTAQRILVIKLGALGDFVQALGPFEAIRAHHNALDDTDHAHITLLTTPPFAGLARDSGFFDDVWEDGRAKGFGALLSLVRRMSWAQFTRVYDLQTSSRSSLYFHLLWPRTQWSGIARGCSHPHTNPQRDFMHTVERQAEQLRDAGIARTPLANVAPLAGVRSAGEIMGHEGPYGLLIPGAAPHRPAKRWPVERFAEVASIWATNGVRPLVLGTQAETPLAAWICAHEPTAVDLTGSTSLNDIVTLALGAKYAVGNDTGPMHLVSLAGTPSVALFGADSDPALCAPRGPQVCVLEAPDISAHSPARVMEALEASTLKT